MDDKLDLEAIKARYEAASMGPWTTMEWALTYVCVDSDIEQDRERPLAECYYHVGRYPAEANAEFIAHARSDIPRLVARVEQLEQLVKGGTRINTSNIAT